jgi:putative DNA primase/helicase
MHSSIERLLTFNDRIVLEPGRWDEDPDLLGTPAGVIDLRTGELKPYTPEHRISKYTAVAPAADDDDWVPERWERFLTEALQDDVDAIEALRQFLGYCATGHTREHVFLALLGRGGAGVSTFVNTCMHVLGSYAQATSPETFTSSPNDKHPADLAALVGVRLVVAPEVERGRRWAESRLKSFTAGDPISARVMRGDPFTFRPVAKVIVTGNSLPGLSAVDPAIRRRLLVKTFDNVPAIPQRDLLERLVEQEGSQILRWIIEGASIWYERGLDIPGSMRAAADRYLDTEDVLGIWLDECVVVDKDASESSAELFRSWRELCDARNESPGTAKAFAQLLQGRGFKADKNVPDAVSGCYRRGFRGLRLRT